MNVLSAVPIVKVLRPRARARACVCVRACVRACACARVCIRALTA